MKNNRKSVIFALLAVLLWSTVGTAFKITLAHLNYASLLLWSSLVSVVFLAILLVYNKQYQEVLKTPLKSLRYSALLGFLNPFAYYLILFKAYSLLRAQEAVALNYIWPMMLVLLSVPILKQKISFLSIFALVISFAGAIVIATHGDIFSLDFKEPVGVALALSSALFWALFWLLNVRDKREESVKLFLNFLFGFLYTFMYCIITGTIMVPNIQGLSGSVYIGLFEMGITFVFWLKALKYAVNTAKVSNLVYLSPFMSLIFISLILGERIMLSTLAGLSMIILGIVMQQFNKEKKSI